MAMDPDGRFGHVILPTPLVPSGASKSMFPPKKVLRKTKIGKEALYIVCFILLIAVFMTIKLVSRPVTLNMDNIEIRTNTNAPPLLRDQDIPNYSVEEKMYLAKSTPVIVPAGTVILNDKRLHISAQECLGPFCSDKPAQSDNNTVHIKGDIIVSHLSTHYFHFVYETMLRLWGLRLHEVLVKYPNSSILWFGDRPNKQNVEMMKAIWPEFPMNKSIFGKPDTQYQVDHLSTMVITRHNDYHSKDPWQDYNFWLINSIRETLQIIDDPEDQLFISRRGIRRGIAHEFELYVELRSSILPNLKIILPDDFSVAEQTRIFANAKLIIAPHGASLTNALFSNWDKMVLIELTKADSWGAFGTFRRDLEVKQHYLLKCQSVPCMGSVEECDPWNTQIDANIQNATETIKRILLGNQSQHKDIFISADSTE